MVAQTTVSEEIKKITVALKSAFSADSAIGFVYLFGSRARGDEGPKSDYDIAVYFDEYDPARRHQALVRLSDAISQVLHFDLVDVKSINDIQSPELKYHILHEGILLYEHGPSRVVIEPRMLNEYFDFVYLLKKYNLTKQLI